MTTLPQYHFSHSSACGPRLSLLNHTLEGGTPSLSLGDSFWERQLLFFFSCTALTSDGQLICTNCYPHPNMVIRKISSPGLTEQWSVCCLAVITWFALGPVYGGMHTILRNDIHFCGSVEALSLVSAMLRFFSNVSNLRKGTPAIDHRLWAWWTRENGLWESNPETSSMETAWLLMAQVWVVQSTSRWHILTCVSAVINFSQWNVNTVALVQDVLNCDLSVDWSGWLQSPMNEVFWHLHYNFKTLDISKKQTSSTLVWPLCKNPANIALMGFCEQSAHVQTAAQ